MLTPTMYGAEAEYKYKTEQLTRQYQASVAFQNALVAKIGEVVRKVRNSLNGTNQDMPVNTQNPQASY